MSTGVKSRAVYENLDTSFVNLGALLHYLRRRGFTGRVHVRLDQYEAEVFLQGSNVPRAREVDHSSGRSAEGEEAMQRLLVRATEGGGLINVYEGRHEEMLAASEMELQNSRRKPDVAVNRNVQREEDEDAPLDQLQEEIEWHDLLRISGELVAAVERAGLAIGSDFTEIFRAARVELADDYTFLDPSLGRFRYAHGVAHLQSRPSVKEYVAGLGACLRRTVEGFAQGPRAGAVRERVALELAVLARRRRAQLSRFHLDEQLDRVAGTRVL